MTAPVLRIADLQLAGTRQQVLAKDRLDQLKLGLRDVRKGDQQALFAVLDKHFARAVPTAANGDVDEFDERMSKRVKPEPREEIEDEWVRRIGSLEGMPPEVLEMIFDRLLFDDRWILGDTLYQKDKTHQALVLFRAFLSRSVGFLNGVLPDTNAEVEASTLLPDEGAFVLATLYAFIVDLRNPLTEAYSADEKMWVSMGGMVDTRLAYQSNYPVRYTTYLAVQTRKALELLWRETDETRVHAMMAKLSHRGVLVEKLFDQLAIFLDGYPRSIEVARPAGQWARVLTLLDETFFLREIRLPGAETGTSFGVTDAFLQMILGSYSTENPAVGRSLTYSELYARRRLQLTFDPYELAGLWSKARTFDSEHAIGEFHYSQRLTVIQFQHWQNQQYAVEPNHWVPVYTLGLNLSLVELDFGFERNVAPTDTHKAAALALFATAFGVHDMQIIVKRGIPDTPFPVIGANRVDIHLKDVQRFSVPLRGEQAISAAVSGLILADESLGLIPQNRAIMIQYLLDAASHKENGGVLEFLRLPWVDPEKRRQLGTKRFWRDNELVDGSANGQAIVDVLFSWDLGGTHLAFFQLKKALMEAQRTAPWKVEGKADGAFYNSHSFDTRSGITGLDGIVDMSRLHYKRLWVPTIQLPTSAYALISFEIEAGWAGEEGPVPSYYQPKQGSNRRVLYLLQSTRLGDDAFDPVSTISILVQDILLDQDWRKEYLQFADLAPKSAELGPRIAFDYNIIPQRAWWEMWMRRHLNALHPTTLVFFALHPLDRKATTREKRDTFILAWRLNQDSVSRFFEWMQKGNSKERSRVSKLFNSADPPPLGQTHRRARRRELGGRVIKARTALYNIIHSTPDTKIAKMGEFLRQIPPIGQPVLVRAAFDQPFWEALQEETGWGVDAWPVSIVRDNVHLELFMD